jgi:hypothetical protein
MTRKDLITSVQNVLEKLDATYLGSAQESDLYEAALLAEATAAVEASSGTTVMVTNDGSTPAQQLVFRVSPGHLWKSGYTYVIGSANVGALEIHLGVKVTGSSRVAHECDIAIITKDEADLSRTFSRHPRRDGLLAAIEAKNYAASPPLAIGRGFLGLALELGRRKCRLVFPATGRNSITRLFRRKASKCFDQVIPGTPQADPLRNWITARIT